MSNRRSSLLSQMNQVQKASLATFICLVVLLVFLHNPLSGYAIEIEQHPLGPRPCTEAERKQLKESYEWAERNLKPSGYTAEQIEQKARECTSLVFPPQYLPFDLWQTKLPHIYWLGFVVNLLFTVLCLAVMTSAVFFIFRTRSGTAPSTE